MAPGRLKGLTPQQQLIRERCGGHSIQSRQCVTHQQQRIAWSQQQIARDEGLAPDQVEQLLLERLRGHGAGSIS